MHAWSMVDQSVSNKIILENDKEQIIIIRRQCSLEDPTTWHFMKPYERFRYLKIMKWWDLKMLCHIANRYTIRNRRRYLWYNIGTILKRIMRIQILRLFKHSNVETLSSDMKWCILVSVKLIWFAVQTLEDITHEMLNIVTWQNLYENFFKDSKYKSFWETYW